MAPRNAYLEFAAQPATMTPYTPMEVSDSRYSRPASAFDTTTVGDSGITAQAANAGTSATMGASRNRNLFEFVGMMTSFTRSLSTCAVRLGVSVRHGRRAAFTRSLQRRRAAQQRIGLVHRHIHQRRTKRRAGLIGLPHRVSALVARGPQRRTRLAHLTQDIL